MTLTYLYSVEVSPVKKCRFAVFLLICELIDYDIEITSIDLESERHQYKPPTLP